MNINDMVSLCMHVCANDNVNVHVHVHVKSRTTRVVGKALTSLELRGKS